MRILALLFQMLALIQFSMSCSDMQSTLGTNSEEDKEEQRENPHQNYANLVGKWGGCLQKIDRSSHYVEIDIREDMTYTKRTITYAANGDPCQKEKEWKEEVLAGTFEKVDDPYYSGYHILWTVDSYQIGFYHQAPLLQANGTYKTESGTFDPNLVYSDQLCKDTIFRLSELQDIIGRTCLNSSEAYEIKASFSHEDRLYIDSDVDSLVVTYNIVPDIFSDRKEEYTEFHYPSDSLKLSRSSAAQEISADLTFFSDMDRVREYMQGTWEVCYEDKKSVLTFDGDRYTQETTTYSSSSNCLDWYAVYKQTLSGSFELVGHDEEAANGTFKINWLMDGFQLTPLSNSVASSWNVDSLCTDVVFSAFTASSLMSKNCNLNGDGYEVFSGSTLYDRMAVYPDGLADSDFDQDGGDTPETRRTQINWNLIFKKSDSL